MFFFVKYLLLLCFSLFLLFIYQPFSSTGSYNQKLRSKFEYVHYKKLSQLLPLSHLDTSNVFLPNAYSISNAANKSFSQTDVESLVCPDELIISKIFFAKPFFSDFNISISPRNNNTAYLNRKPFSTFGVNNNSAGMEKQLFYSDYSVFFAGGNQALLRNQLPSIYLELVNEKLLDPLELFFNMRNNSIFGTPTISKSSGNEEVDRAISLLLKESASSMSLLDGYYRFTLSR